MERWRLTDSLIGDLELENPFIEGRLENQKGIIIVWSLVEGKEIKSLQLRSFFCYQYQCLGGASTGKAE